MAKGKKRPAELPEYGTVMMKGVQYYRTRITDADGKRVAIYGLTREELYDRVEDAQKKIAEVVFHRENPTVEEYCEKWLLMRSGTVRTNTLEGYARMVNRYIVGPIGQMYMDEVTTDDLRLLMVPCYYQYNGNTVEYCVEIVKQEAADGQGEAADYMVIFAKKHDGEEGGEIWTPPAL